MYRKLQKYERAVFSINELARIFHMTKAVASVYVYRMVKKELLYRIEKNKVSTNNDQFIIASQLNSPAYISFTTAFALHHTITQIPAKIYITTSRKRKSINILGMETLFVTIKPKYIFGYRKIRKGHSYIMLADLEKAIIDCLYLPRYCHLQYVVDALREADIAKVESYARTFGKEVVLRRLGYLLDVLGKKHTLQRTTSTPYILYPIIRSKGTFNNKWYLYINVEVRPEGNDQ